MAIPNITLRVVPIADVALYDIYMPNCLETLNQIQRATPI